MLRSIFSCILVHFHLDPESKIFTSLCRIADLFPLTLSLSDMSPSRIHLCCCGKEMKKKLSLNPCMHVPFDFIVCISDWWFCFLLTMYSGCHWYRVNKLSICYFSVFTFVAFLLMPFEVNNFSTSIDAFWTIWAFVLNNRTWISIYCIWSIAKHCSMN